MHSEKILILQEVRYVEINNNIVSQMYYKLKYFDFEIEHYGAFSDALIKLAKTIKASEI